MWQYPEEMDSLKGRGQGSLAWDGALYVLLLPPKHLGHGFEFVIASCVTVS